MAMRKLLSVAVLVSFAASARADHWPQWRGPKNDGHSAETGLPAKWSAENAVWKLPMPGQGGSTPAVWGDRIFLTSEDGPDVVLMCVSTAGKELWRRPLGTHNGKKYMSGEGNNASASPTTDGKHVWAFDGAGHLACFTVAGEPVWSLDVQAKYGEFKIWHGMHVTPLIDGDRIYLSLLHSNAALVLALDKMTGREIWKHTRASDATDENEHSYASPLIWRRGGDEYLVVHGGDYCTAHRLTDGTEIWRLGGLNPPRPGEPYNKYLRFVATPLVTPDLIVVPTAKKGPVVGLDPAARGKIDRGSPGEIWRSPRITPDVPSPLMHDGRVYLCSETGLFSCLDAKTGQEVYPPVQLRKGIYRASPVFAGGLIYVTGRDGVTTVIRSGPLFEKVAENPIGDDVSASLAPADGRIYIRGWKSLYAVGRP
jgi:outer membrane protein assembly factor BamB